VVRKDTKLMVTYPPLIITGSTEATKASTLEETSKTLEWTTPRYTLIQTIGASLLTIISLGTVPTLSKIEPTLLSLITNLLLLKSMGWLWEGWKGVSRDSVMDYVNKWAQDSGYAGSLVWEVKAGNAQHSQGYVFSYGEDGTDAVTRQYTWAKEKKGGGASGAGGNTPGGGGGGGSQSEECPDIPPNNTYTCVQQAGWVKCKESWKQGFCLKSCDRCTTGGGGGTCTDASPDKRYTCQQQAKWGKCSVSWMKGYCQKTCGRC